MRNQVNPRMWSIHDRYYPTLIGGSYSAPLTVAPAKYQGFIDRDVFKKSPEEKDQLKEMKMNTEKKKLTRILKGAF